MTGSNIINNNTEIIGTPLDDILPGTSGDDRMRSLPGADVLLPGAGDDTVDGGPGKDTVSYEDAPGRVLVDLEQGFAEDGEGGVDSLIDIESARGSRFEDTLLGDAHSNDLDGGDGADLMRGRAGADTLTGRAGDDTLRGGAGADEIDGGEGDDDIDGGFGDDLLIGGAGTDVVRGGAGSDELVGGPGDDELDGGPGEDKVNYSDSPSGVRVDLDLGFAEDGFGTRDILIGIENICGSEFADTLIGSAGDNIIEGLGGRDIIEGLAGADVIDGGAGIDRVDYEESPAGVRVDLAAGEAEDGFGARDVLRNVEDILGSNSADTLRGDASTNVIEGRAGNDVIDGRGGFDTADYFFSPDRVVVDLAKGSAANDGYGSNDTLIGIEGLRGSAFADRLSGDDNDNVFDGLKGNDLINGRGGFDTADYLFSPEGVVVDLLAGRAEDGHGTTDELVAIESVRGSAFSDAISGSDEADLLEGNAGGDELHGGRGADQLLGGIGGDELFGDNGDDVLFGDLGDDLLTGGAGADVFLYTAAEQGGDRITDLAADDRIDLSQMLTGFAAGASEPTDFVNLVDAGADAILQVDPAGGGDFDDLTTIAGGAGTTVGELLGNLVLSEPAAPA